jgi:hypothetical protein
LVDLSLSRARNVSGSTLKTRCTSRHWMVASSLFRINVMRLDYNMLKMHIDTTILGLIVDMIGRTYICDHLKVKKGIFTLTFDKSCIWTLILKLEMNICVIRIITNLR